ncbi:MAG: transketolase, partial [Chitinivibrionales bacterium]|nr:transketolase [Chitinivibrionales bacterium]MBD3394443.1 transketolase [Chitinivibrionales bacterium]
AGITLGAFHSGEFEGLWSRFPGLKILYPATAQETFEALVAGFYDPNPCLVLEHKLLYWTQESDIDFDGNLDAVFHPRRYREGTDLTVVAFGAMVQSACAAIDRSGYTADVWNPFILVPSVLKPILESVEKTGRLVVVQESNRLAGLGDHLVSQVVESAFRHLKCEPHVVAACQTPVPFARELEAHYIPDPGRIQRSIVNLMESSS